MALSDTQIERFSRQIILPQVGGRGQERLLRSSVALAGDRALLEIAALSLAGAGIGRIILHDEPRLLDELIDVHPEMQAESVSSELASVAADVLVACDTAVAEVDRAAAARRPLVAGGLVADGGWFVVADHPDACASCVAREATARGVRELAPALGWDGEANTAPLAPTPKRRQAAALHTDAGIVGSLMSLAVTKLCLGLDTGPRATWLQFDRSELMLSAHRVTPAPDCPVCQRQSP